MKILSYNLDHGGKKGIDPQARWPKLIRVIKNLKPDMAILFEAWGWKKSKELREFKKNSKFTYSVLSQSNTKHHIAFLSHRKPEKVKKYKSGFHHSVIEVHYTMPTKQKIVIFGIHLNPKSETLRVSEAKRIISKAKNFSHVIILGDYNSLSPIDPYDKKILTIFKKRKIVKFGKSTLSTKVIRMFLEAGFFDLNAMFSKNNISIHTVPTKSTAHSEHVVKLRLDYAFASKSLVPYIKNVRIIKNSITHFASDHYPLVVEFKM